MDQEVMKALCPNCGGLRKSTIHGVIQTHWADDEHFIYGSYTHHLLQCNGCETVYYQQNEHFSEHMTHELKRGEWVEVPIDMITTFPTIDSSNVPSWIAKLEAVDAQLHQIFTEVYSAYSHDMLILSSIGLQTIFDRTTEILQIHPGLPLAEKVKNLQVEGFIGDTEAKILSSVIDAGNAAAHRSWSPKKAEFAELLAAIEGFVQRTILSKRSLAHITNQLPPKPKKPK